MTGCTKPAAGPDIAPEQRSARQEHEQGDPEAYPQTQTQKDSTPAREAAQNAEVVVTALPKPHHVTAAMQGDDGILAGLQDILGLGPGQDYYY